MYCLTYSALYKGHQAKKCTQVLQPAIELADEGFPVSPITAVHWQSGLRQLRAAGGPGIAALTTADGGCDNQPVLALSTHTAALQR